ncbi:related to MUS-26 protein MUS-26, involved in DNA repair [Phialocephala subalpina]|uniref:Related to MUS-26 protein MUS-26, involved in DNA repair n=1 Tax=Phialocephala subalpina TaxID=576137 RepID=A0A1L7XHR0_9HELO|nr:related to MUS-26 protein MUS-26, involved in DNA repair [Phialocephala subalpina]
MAPPSTLLTNNTSLLQTFTDFLTVAIHTILYSRALYPPASFISTRKYNFPVRQNRHPDVCAWINNAVSSTYTLLQKGTVRAIAVVIYSREQEVMERYMFDVSRFPIVDPKEGLTDFEARKDKEGDDLPVGISRADIEEQLRATIRKLAYGAGKLSPLPEGCTFSVAVELRNEADPPIGHPQPWIPSEPSLQTGERTSERIGTDLGGAKSTPVRLVEAGEFILETWIEEGKAKLHDDDD